MSLGDLAKSSDVSKSYLWKLETHEDPNPGVIVIYKISKALGVSAWRLFEGDDEKKPVLFYFDEAYYCWFPLWDDAVKELEGVLDWPSAYENGEEFEIRLKRMDMTDEELNSLPEV